METEAEPRAKGGADGSAEKPEEAARVPRSDRLTMALPAPCPGTLGLEGCWRIKLRCFKPLKFVIICYSTCRKKLIYYSNPSARPGDPTVSPHLEHRTPGQLVSILPLDTHTHTHKCIHSTCVYV